MGGELNFHNEAQHYVPLTLKGMVFKQFSMGYSKGKKKQKKNRSVILQEN